MEKEKVQIYMEKSKIADNKKVMLMPHRSRGLIFVEFSMFSLCLPVYLPVFRLSTKMSKYLLV